jgi:Phage holin protein (Holin_LLH).
MQAYIDQVVQALVGLLVVFVLGVIASLRVKVNAWLASRTTAQQREILHRLATEGMALAEATYASLDGPAKLNRALQYVVERASAYGIDVSVETIRAAVEKVVLEYNSKVKSGEGQ